MKKIFFSALLSLMVLVANAGDFYPSKGVDKIATITEAKTDFDFSIANGYKVSMDAGDFITLTINNNESAGYNIYATATNGKLLHPSLRQEINYTLTCKSFLTDAGGFTVPAVTNINLPAGVPTLVYHVISPTNTTVNATAYCDMVPDPSKDLDELFGGEYDDDIVFSMSSI